MITSILERLHTWFRPTLVGLFNPNISWANRWRLLLFQPLVLLTYSIISIPYIFKRPFKIEHLPIWANRSVRVLVYKAAGTGVGRKLRPLHVEVHGGGFVGGVPDGHAVFDDKIARETGAVVIGITYRMAPEHVFPTHIDDVDATIKYIQDHAEEKWGADATLMTISGFSAGGTLALAATQKANCHEPSSTAIKASAIFYAPVDLRTRQADKPLPGSAKGDPMRVFLPLFDSYAEPLRSKHLNDPRMSPALSRRETLPDRMLLVVPGLDIIVPEQLAFAERVNQEDAQSGERGGQRVEVLHDETAFHGYLETPDAVVKKELKDEVFGQAIKMFREVHQQYGWTWHGQ